MKEAEMKTYERPRIEDIGHLKDLTRGKSYFGPVLPAAGQTYLDGGDESKSGSAGGGFSDVTSSWE
jgi:hypothetical protein